MAGLPGLATGNSRLKPESLGSAGDGPWRRTREAVTREQERGQKRKTGGQDANAQFRDVLNTTDLCSCCDLPGSACPVPFSRPPKASPSTHRGSRKGWWACALWSRLLGIFASDWHQPQERVILALCLKVAKQLGLGEVGQPEITVRCRAVTPQSLVQKKRRVLGASTHPRWGTLRTLCCPELHHGHRALEYSSAGHCPSSWVSQGSLCYLGLQECPEEAPDSATAG